MACRIPVASCASMECLHRVLMAVMAFVPILFCTATLHISLSFWIVCFRLHCDLPCLTLPPALIELMALLLFNAIVYIDLC